MSSAAGATPAAVITTKNDTLGTILAVGSERLTVYPVRGRQGQELELHGRMRGCVAAGGRYAAPGRWRAYLGSGDDHTAGRNHPGDLTKGDPLYTFVKDKDDGDTYGRGSTGFGAGWYVLKPSGSKIDQS